MLLERGMRKVTPEGGNGYENITYCNVCTGSGSGKGVLHPLFGAKAGELYHNPKTGLKSYFLSFDEGTRLELMNLPEMQDQKKVLVRMGYIHIAISVGSREKVDAITEKLYEAGYDVLSGPRITGDGYYESTVLGPEDNQIEITE